MAAGIGRDELEVEQALLGQPDDGGRPRDAGKDAAHHGATLVEDRPRPDPARGERLDRQLGPDAGHLLVVAEGEVDVAGGGEPVGDQ
jgi:hypothetical protein